jgi:DNA mismatch endonuclease (patch repair protein)
MQDRLSSEGRSENMRRIRSKNTRPELIVRKFLHSMGYRYRLHEESLPGNPDIVFKKLRKIVLVHGCFWHMHGKCREGRIPNSRREYWESKLLRNAERDARNLAELQKLGWKVLTVWECELTNWEETSNMLTKFLG